jgi:uncharacterized protein (DUF2141 family)
MAQTILIEITGLKNKSGKIHLDIYKDARSFNVEHPFITKNIAKSSMSNGKMYVRFHLQPGTYGITMIDDLNGNGDMDFNLLGIPKEGFGFSNFNEKIRKKPHFNDFKFHLSKDKEVKVRIKVNYI